MGVRGSVKVESAAIIPEPAPSGEALHDAQRRSAEDSGFFTSDGLRPSEPPAEELPMALARLGQRHPELGDVLGLAALLAPGNIPIAIEGAAGSPKDRLAIAIHAASGRTDAHMVTVSCRQIAQVDADLASTRPGVGLTLLTGALERARGGTLVLDEPGDLSLATQDLLFHALTEPEEYNPVRPARILVTTSRDLEKLTDEGKFLRALLYELADARLVLPGRGD